MPRLILSTVFILLIFGQIVSAQDTGEDAVEGWEIVERCVGEPITAPDDWTFDGTILASGWAGIHGINADWDVPRVLAFNDRWNTEIGGALSPNNEWFAVTTVSERRDNDSIWRLFIIEYTLEIYNLVDRSLQISFDWQNQYDVVSGSGASRYYYQRIPRWLDNETILYQRVNTLFEININTQEIIESSVYWESGIFSPLFPDYIMSVSPDFSRTVFRENRGQYALVEMNTGTNISIPAELSPDESYSIGAIVNWSSDSSIFTVGREYQIKLFDRDGEIITIIDSAGSPVDNAFSPNSNSFVYFHDGTVHIADIQNQQLIDTCFSDYYRSIAWSPSNNFIATIGDYPETSLQVRPIYVMDLNTYQIYIVAYHDGRIIGWREDPE
ncbi:MAG: hypothetical protein Phog2KO_04490 [Phototrophicaceae bacterium]